MTITHKSHLFCILRWIGIKVGSWTDPEYASVLYIFQKSVIVNGKISDFHLKKLLAYPNCENKNKMSYAIPLVIRVSIEFLHYKLKLTKLIWQIIYSAEKKKKANQIKAEISYINIYMCVYNIYLYTMLLWSTYMYLRKKNQ